MRQTWVNVTAPLGETYPIAAQTLLAGSQLNESACNTSQGSSSFIEAFDFDLKAGVASIGYTAYPTDAASAVTGGLCFADIGTGVDAAAPGWTDRAEYGGSSFDFALPPAQLGSSSGYPKGLPPPMPQPWKVTPTRAKRLDKDFALPTDRNALLARLAADGDLGQAGVTGVYFYDAATGAAHAYMPVSYQLLYDPKTAPLDVAPPSYVVIPVREAELKYRADDPVHPNCIGRYRGDFLDPSADCFDPGEPASMPAWAGLFDSKLGEGDATTQGYYLITELEQVYLRILAQTLCVAFPTLAVAKSDGWATDTETRCRTSSKWNPSDPVNGLPHGDWCAATNSPATATCHDAYRGSSFQAFQAFRLKAAHCKAL